MESTGVKTMLNNLKACQTIPGHTSPTDTFPTDTSQTDNFLTDTSQPSFPRPDKYPTDTSLTDIIPDGHFPHGQFPTKNRYF